MPPWMTSSAPQETSRTRSPRRRVNAHALGQRDEHRHCAEVVVGPRHDRAASDVGGQRGDRRAQRDARRGQLPAAGERAERNEQWAGDDRPPDRQRGIDARHHGGEAPSEPALKALIEHLAGRGGVVVGQDHQRALRPRVARRGEHVERAPALGHQAAPQPWSVGHVVDEQAGGQQRDQRGEQHEPGGRGRVLRPPPRRRRAEAAHGRSRRGTAPARRRR